MQLGLCVRDLPKSTLPYHRQLSILSYFRTVGKRIILHFYRSTTTTHCQASITCGLSGSRVRVKMSKNTQSDKFRKVNVEDFDEDAYKEDEADAPSGNDDNFVAQKETEVKKLTQSYPFVLSIRLTFFIINTVLS